MAGLYDIDVIKLDVSSAGSDEIISRPAFLGVFSGVDSNGALTSNFQINVSFKESGKESTPITQGASFFFDDQNDVTRPKNITFTWEAQAQCKYVYIITAPKSNIFKGFLQAPQTISVNKLAGNFTAGQAAMSTSAALIKSSDTDTLKTKLKNTGLNTVYVGSDNTVSGASDGYPIGAGETVDFDHYYGDLYGICASGTSNISFWREGN